MSEGTVLGLGAMAVSIVTLIWKVLERRDQLKYDVKLAVLEAKQGLCEQDSAAKGIRIAVLEAHIVTLTARDVKDRGELEEKIKQVDEKATANGSDSGTKLPTVT